MTSTPRTRLSADQRRAQIAAAARELALAEGLAAVTLRAVASRVGVASGLVAHYVPSMDDLVADTFSDIVSAELAELATLLDAIDDSVERVRALLSTLLDGSRTDVTLVWVQSWAMGERNEVLAAAVRAHMDAWQGFIAGVLERGVDERMLRVEDPQAVAWLLLGMIDGLSAHGLVRWGEPAGRRALMARAIEPLLGLDAGSLADEREKSR
ncbi:TetR/AcrR family transcriptional regulator [Microbacterium sp. C7(2022)]|uniref:TetR/AcrR family transcriptional regulator n=1 Tax=Microbacterium sp. C7(2022) TaxID=2992759 RepID=UPI00237C4161|nr:TetR family transcriptional regulator C-terminal domain-containing protein [Microbacterium sp. C7(2022)]MDE0546407.1 TetR family transcriptional regulator C-terminal domain-containing protein [Microbacterium sp. C7(2022)]